MTHTNKTWLPEVIESLWRIDDFGHLYKHIGCSNEFLRSRVIEEGVFLASSFEGKQSDIIEMIKDALLNEANLELLSAYLSDREWDDPLFIEEDISGPIRGYGYASKKHDWDNGPLELTKFVVVVKKTHNPFQNPFFVASAYPELSF